MWPFKKKKVKTVMDVDAENAIKIVMTYPNASFEGRIATAYGMVKKRNSQMSDASILSAVSEALNGFNRS